MKTISYLPAKDKLVLTLRSLRGKPTKEVGRYRMWWDDEGRICGMEIMPYMDELEEFKKDLNRVQLGGIWKGIEITAKDIEETRADLIQKLEEKY